MSSARRILLRGVQLLEGPDQPPRQADVWIEAGRLQHLGPPTGETACTAEASEVTLIEAQHCWLGPPLVDPHSVLEDPSGGRAETLASLEAAAAAGGYGTVALLPWAERRRDHPEALTLQWQEPMRLRLWGSFTKGPAESELADHDALLRAGAIGLAGGSTLPPLPLLERGLRLAEMGERPVLLAPRDPALTQQGFVRERVEALRAGWPIDPSVSEILPLDSLLALRTALGGAPPLRLMNLSTAEGVQRLARDPAPPPASVCWWHLLADSSNLDPTAMGWRVEPSLGGPGDREALIGALASGLIEAVAVHHLPLDAEEMLLSLEQRRAGVAGHSGTAASHCAGVLPALWRELVEKRGWLPQQLWQRLCWGPAAFLGLEPERLEPGSRRWILFNPQAADQPPDRMGERGASRACNHPCPPGGSQGAIVASGLRGKEGWWAPEIPRS